MGSDDGVWYSLTNSFRVEFTGSMTGSGTASQIRSGLSSQVL